jgi:hypothetical protein
VPSAKGPTTQGAGSRLGGEDGPVVPEPSHGPRSEGHGDPLAAPPPPSELPGLDGGDSSTSTFEIDGPEERGGGVWPGKEAQQRLGGRGQDLEPAQAGHGALGSGSAVGSVDQPLLPDGSATNGSNGGQGVNGALFLAAAIVAASTFLLQAWSSCFDTQVCIWCVETRQ